MIFRNEIKISNEFEKAKKKETAVESLRSEVIDEKRRREEFKFLLHSIFTFIQFSPSFNFALHSIFSFIQFSPSFNFRIHSISPSYNFSPSFKSIFPFFQFSLSFNFPFIQFPL